MEPFLISEKRLLELRATHQGRITLSGFNYQAAYAIARLASMLVGRRIFDLPEVPICLRYDWGEDLDEYCEGGLVMFTQCKRIANIGQPAALSSVLLSFAAKWLSVPIAQRPQVRFRLICTDPRFRKGGKISDTVPDSKADTEDCFTSALADPPAPKSDRALWLKDANDYGHVQLFADIWSQTDTLFISGDIVTNHPSGLLLTAERAALVLLLEYGRIVPNKQTDALDRLRRIVHDNLIGFDPTNDNEIDQPIHTPRIRDSADVAYALASCKESAVGALPFEVVDRTFLSRQRQAPRQQFVARQPDWADVIHGPDEMVKFVERSVTSEIRDTVLKNLIEPIERGTDRSLQLLFIVGAPGSGKTTLTRRIAAMLVEEGRVVVADAGLNVHDPVASLEDYVQALEELAELGRPVIFLVDDPLYANSPWIQLFQKLSRPGLGVAVLSPCPKFLFDRHIASIVGGVKHRHEIGRPTEEERREMARLYGRSTAALQSADEFLVIAMEAAAGISFDEIIRRLWLTLNDGMPIPEDDSQHFNTLSWTLRAFITVCFFHRAYVPCPEPILRDILEQTGIQPTVGGVRNALSRLRDQQGWSVFHLNEIDLHSSPYQGVQVLTSHQRIAHRAWQLRPMRWCDIGEHIIAASVRAPQTVLFVGQIAARLTGADDGFDKSFAHRLVDAWLLESNARRIQTRYYGDLQTALQLNGQGQIAARLLPLLRSRAVEVPDGWIAALKLHDLSSDILAQRSFPSDLDLGPLLRVADYSLSPRRAKRLFRLLPRDFQKVFESTMLAAFDGSLGWTLPADLLEWLFVVGPREEMLARHAMLEVWLKDHPQGTHVHTFYLTLLSKQKLGKDQLRQVIANAEVWLNDLPQDTSVRICYLRLLIKQKLDKDLLERVILNFEAWLKDHSQDTNVLAWYLRLLTQQKLDGDQLQQVITKTETWLKDRPQDKNVHRLYLRLLSEQKLSDAQLEQTIANAVKWLRDLPEGTNVHNPYLQLLLTQDLGNTHLERVIADAEACLKDHPHDTNVHCFYLRLLTKRDLDRDKLERIITSTETWLKNHQQDMNVYNAYLGLLINDKLHKTQLTKVIANAEVWLSNHQHDRNVHNCWLILLSRQKLDNAQLQHVITHTEAWLKNNPEDTSGQTCYLRLMSLQTLDRTQLQCVMANTEAWIEKHPHDTKVYYSYRHFCHRLRVKLLP